MASTRSAPRPTSGHDSTGTEAPAPLRAVHTEGFPELLRSLSASLLVTTYQAGKLVIVREQDGRLNTHFRSFQAPMGLGLGPSADRLAIGTSIQVWEFRDVPDVAARLEPQGAHDACFLPRSSHLTGNVEIHEVAYGRGGELWFVNTRFSCLATIDPSASFAPRWRPPFVSKLEPSDRCHLNGLAMHDGAPRYVTALGSVVGLLRFEDAVQEVFAVAVLPRRLPDLINDDETLLANSFVVPTESLPEIAETVRTRRATPPQLNLCGNK
jgi:Domain of unknown function (DUF4915)